MDYLERQAQQLKRVIAAAKGLGEQTIVDQDDQHRAVAEIRAQRCARCGTPLQFQFPLPVPIFCNQCRTEVYALDRAKNPGARWWLEVLTEAHKKLKAGEL